MMPACRQQRPGREAGQAMVEFALTSTLIFTLLFFLADGGRILWNYVQVSQLARQAARYASVRSSESGDEADAAGIAGYVKAQAVGLDDARLAVSVRWPNGNTPDSGNRVEVTVTYSASSLVNLFWSGDVSLMAKSSMIIQN